MHGTSSQPGAFHSYVDFFRSNGWLRQHPPLQAIEIGSLWSSMATTIAHHRGTQQAQRQIARPVISTVSTIPVSGARTVAENNAPMPTMAQATADTL